MTLQASDIRPGTVAHLNADTIKADPAIRFEHWNEGLRDGPFVCIATIGDYSYWLCLTSQRRPERHFIPHKYLLGGSTGWRQRACFVNDLRSVIHANSAAIVAAGQAEHDHVTEERPTVASGGVARILADMLMRKIPLPQPREFTPCETLQPA